MQFGIPFDRSYQGMIMTKGTCNEQEISAMQIHILKSCIDFCYR